jgi:hypothetical protein
MPRNIPPAPVHADCDIVVQTVPRQQAPAVRPHGFPAQVVPAPTKSRPAVMHENASAIVHTLGEQHAPGAHGLLPQS